MAADPKETFTTGSEILLNATDRRLSWGEIQILVPITWSRKPDVYETATYQSFGSANIRVIEGAARDPSVTNHAGCGVQGLDMTFTSGYLLQNVDACSGKAMVREWGRLRWGLFPEHFNGSGYGEANQYYDSFTQRYEPTRCSRDLTGDMIDGDGWSCPENPNGKVDEECVFIPDSEQTTSASLLFGSHCVDSIHQFCDPLVHNYEADNLQNYHCGRRSAWEVMLSTGDITSEDYFPDPNQVDTEPSFTILQQPVRRVVLVLDISGNMSGSYRIDQLIQSSAIFIRHYIPAGSHLSIVTFHSYATVNANLTLVENYDSSREYLVNALPTGTTGNTCIGCGIVTALNVLGDTTNGSYVILLSDGGENDSPYIRDTIQAISESGVVMDTIAITNSADEQMEGLSSMTGGKPYFCIGEDSSACLAEAFLATLSERPELNFVPIPTQTNTHILNGTIEEECSPSKPNLLLEGKVVFQHKGYLKTAVPTTQVAMHSLTFSSCDSRILDPALLPTFRPVPAKSISNIQPWTIFRELAKINFGNGGGPDRIPPRLIQEFAAELSSPLCHIINTSFEQEVNCS
ncbi:calcium-activated chloride channel regulator 1-like [Diadema setosum]|uniref:calcium-activated chloride channel regulator 1-like n=1 Tax=Diadema setosum TaxID=31175 RepID=UPI003B3A1CC4